MNTVAWSLRVVLVTLLLVTIAVVTGGGCWDRLEIEKAAFVNAVGVDRAGNGNVLVTFYMVNPAALGKQMGGGGGGGGGKEPPAFVFSVEARDVSEAMAKYSEESSRRVRFKQLQVVIVGEDLAREGVGPVMDYFSRHWEMRRSIWVLVAKGKAREILVRGQTPPEKLLSAGIKSFMDRRMTLSATRYPVVLGDFLSDMTRTGKEPVAASVEIYPMREATTGGPQGGNGPVAAEGSAEEDKVIAFKGAGVFRKDKLLDFLGPSETRGVLWIQGRATGGRIVVPAPGQGNWASLAVRKESTDVKPVIENDKIRFLINIHEEGYV